MSFNSKFRLFRALTYSATAASVLLYIWLQDSFGAPEQAPKKFWILMTVVVVGIVCCIFFYYYRSKRYETVTQQKIAVETLAKLKRRKK